MSLTHVMRVGKITAPVNESGVIQTMQIKTSSWEIRDNINSIQLYGFASSPKVGCDIVQLNLGADNSNGNVIASNDQRYRPRGMGAGETMVYDDSGQQIYLSKVGGILSIRIVGGAQVNISATTSVNITAPTVAITGNLTVTGTITSTGTMIAGTINLETHRHGGVTTGASNTGTPI